MIPLALLGVPFIYSKRTKKRKAWEEEREKIKDEPSMLPKLATSNNMKLLKDWAAISPASVISDDKGKIVAAKKEMTKRVM